MRRRIYRGWFGTVLVLVLLAPAAARVNEPGGNVTAKQAESLVAEVVPQVEELRGLSFKKPVRVEVVDDAAMREYVLARLHEFDQEARLRQVQSVYELLGLLPAGIDIVELLLGAMEEQAGGYYDPSSGAYYLLGDMPRAVAPIFTAHELTHALEDQHFDLDKRLREVLDDDDKVLARSAVHEGSATLLMSSYAMGAVMRGELDADALLTLAETEAGRADKLEALPRVLLRQLLGPYVLGALFLTEGNLMTLAGGYPKAAVNRVIENGPTSTEQLLHPEKYWDDEKRDEPTEVALGDLSRVLGQGWALDGRGVLGELTLGVLVGAETPVVSGAAGLPDAASWTNDAAAGWGGDLWQLWKRGDETIVLLLTTWDTTDDATEFAEALPDGKRLNSRVAKNRVAIVAGDTGKKTKRLLSRMLK